MHICGNVNTYYYGMTGGAFEEDDENEMDDEYFVSEKNYENRN